MDKKSNYVYMKYIVGLILIGHYVSLRQLISTHTNQSSQIRQEDRRHNKALNEANNNPFNNAAAVQGSWPSSPSSQCLSLNFNETMDDLLSKHKQVFITMPPKAAGVTMTFFTRACMMSKDDQYTEVDFNDVKDVSAYLSSSLHLSSILSKHTLSRHSILNLAKISNRKSLIIYVHRDETERIVSAIKQVLKVFCNFNNKYKHVTEKITKEYNIEKNSTHCTLDEGPVIQMIQYRINEIQATELSCETYGAFEEHDPNLVFIHYKQVDSLQKLLAKHHCPQLLEYPPVHRNVEEEEIPWTMSLRLQKDSKQIVNIHEWLDEKENLLEWTLSMNRDASCLGKTKHMENELFSCPDQAIKTTADSIRGW